MMLFNDFVQKCKLKQKATSNIKRQQVFSSLSLKDVGIYLRDGLFNFDLGIVNLHAFRGTHWILFIHECFFLIHMVVLLLKSYLNLLQNEMDVVCILNIRFKKR